MRNRKSLGNLPDVQFFYDRTLYAQIWEDPYCRTKSYWCVSNSTIGEKQRWKSEILQCSHQFNTKNLMLLSTFDVSFLDIYRGGCTSIGQRRELTYILCYIWVHFHVAMVLHFEYIAHQFQLLATHGTHYQYKSFLKITINLAILGAAPCHVWQICKFVFRRRVDKNLSRIQWLPSKCLWKRFHLMEQLRNIQSYKCSVIKGPIGSNRWVVAQIQKYGWNNIDNCVRDILRN